MKDICRTLSTAFPGALIRDRIEFAQYENSFSENGSRYVIEFYFDIALGEGKSLCWWIDVEYIGEIWKIEASLRRDDGAGENCVWKATYQATTPEEVFSRLSTVLDEVERFAYHERENPGPEG